MIGECTRLVDLLPGVGCVVVIYIFFHQTSLPYPYHTLLLPCLPALEGVIRDVTLFSEHHALGGTAHRV